MRKTLLTLSVAALTLAACSSDGGTGPDGGGDATLSAAEVAQLNQLILIASASVRGHQDTRDSAPTGQSTGTLNFTFSETEPCGFGGNIGVAGGMSVAWNDVAGTSSFSTDFAVDPNACVLQTTSGTRITLSGDPDIDVTMNAARGPDGYTTFVIHETGAFTCAKGANLHGRCTLDVRAEMNPAVGALVISGSFCGVPVSGTYDED
ncbi:MAG TPA: hypothetical protein VM759_02510 [Longimicrobium sp.]|nr:hypothetical protein [Longimicrobium sp.]